MNESHQLEKVHWLLCLFRDEELQYQYKQRKQQLDLQMSNAKHDYFTNLINSAPSKTKKIWNIVSQQKDRKQGKDSKKDLQVLSTNGEILTKPDKIANEFGDYFSSVANDKLNLAYGTSSNNNTTSTKRQPSNTFFLEEVNARDITRAIKDVKNKIFSGMDGIQSSLLKKTYMSILPTLTFLCGQVIDSGQFLQLLK
ncbi:hypothetical protein HHI36_014655 [Cryptolaemus montrouzieri]|uniref:Uncharacterized protein n=1 Tax=Cryptolaemus montrouzieri TaxID=559131 RepID=A0ABD2N4F1_9CUCU